MGILSLNSVLYLWDQFFMVKWELNYIEHACRAILYLLRDNFMYAENYEEMRKVFLNEPCLLYTSDVQTAFVHLALKQDDPKYIPAMNQRIRPMRSLDNIEIRPNKQKIILESVGIEHISLTLITPSVWNLNLIENLSMNFSIRRKILDEKFTITQSLFR